MLTVLDYSLPDIDLLEKEDNSFLVWIPEQTYIVLGASNNHSDAVIAENVIRDGIPVLKRKSGGQTVMLTPNNVVVSAVVTDDRMSRPLDVFQDFNKLIVRVIEKCGMNGLSARGISDLAINEKKILGSSIYRRKNKLLYHAVINFGEPASTFEKYLKHPSKEPDYRNGRSHSDFVTSLQEAGFKYDIYFLRNAIIEVLGSNW